MSKNKGPESTDNTMDAETQSKNLIEEINRRYELDETAKKEWTAMLNDKSERDGAIVKAQKLIEKFDVEIKKKSKIIGQLVNKLRDSDVDKDSYQRVMEQIDNRETVDQGIANAKTLLSNLATQKKNSKREHLDLNEVEPTPEPTLDNENEEWKKLVATEDFKTYAQMQQAMGMIPSDADFDKLDAEKKEFFKGELNAWIAAGRPKPTMKNLGKSKPVEIMAVYRVKIYGRQKLAWKIQGQEVMGGVKKIPQYRKTRDSNDNPIDDKTTIIGYVREYTEDYSDAKAKKLVKRCMSECALPQFYFREGNATIAVKDPLEHFTGDFDDLMRVARSGTVI